jgi:hypothetical protein
MVMSNAITLGGEAAEVSRAEAQAVLALVHDEERRGRLAALVAAIDDGSVGREDAQALEEVLELSLQTGRLRALYGPGGEQAALKTYRQLPRGRELGRSARAVSEALSSLEGRAIESVTLQSVGPGAYLLLLEAGGTQLNVRLDRQGARLVSVGV